MQAMRPGSSASSRRAGHERDQYAPRGTSRSRDGSKGQTTKPPSQRAMLSKALQKANTAVQFDNVQNFTEARQAYTEANQLLYDLLQKTVQEEDRTKLETIRRTYTSRISELDQMALLDSKALPAPPVGHDEDDYPQLTTQEPSRPGTASSRHRDPTSLAIHTRTESRSPGGLAPSPNLRQNGVGYFSRQGLSPQPSHSPMSDNSNSLQQSLSPASFQTRSPLEEQVSQGIQDRYPKQLHHVKIQAPQSPPRTESIAAGDSFRSDFSTSSERSVPRQTQGHLRSESQNSWLDPINESGGSRGSSVHSRTSSLGYRRRHLRGGSGDTEAEFDNALDEAIEAAYDDGYEPVTSGDYRKNEHGEEIVANALRKVEMARERVRQTEKEAYGMLGRGKPTRQRGSGSQARDARDDLLDGNSSEDEERMLEAMTKDSTVDDYLPEPQRKPRIPRESDSSGTTSRTWHSSVGSNPPTASTILSPVTESSIFSSMSKPTTLPPMQSLPEIPNKAPASLSTQSVRSRRMSGHNPKQLKIETAKLVTTTGKNTVSNEAGEITSAPTQGNATEVPPSDTPWSHDGLTHPLSPLEDQASSEARHFGSPIRRPTTRGDEEGYDRSGSPNVNRLRKNFSSSSLRSMKNRNMSLSNLDETSDMSPGTPSGSAFGISRAPAVPALPTAASLRERIEASTTGGLHLFDDDFHSQNDPGSPNPSSLDAPVSLEPCPQDFMLRPFWLMRCLFQTLVNPRGGYVSTKLFVPRDVWKVKGVKLKGIEDKIANCDFLTAALLKLAKVDTFDADALLEEMQSLEGILEQAQASLTRKLGSEVGVQGSSILFKDASAPADGEMSSGVSKTASGSSKSSSFSWRRLRSKNSAMSLGGSYTSRVAGHETRDHITIPTLPMVANAVSKPPKRDIALAQFTGPNANYMSSLARLFDAAQAVDAVARQVDDPGLRGADKTQVGLELCTRHAAEFFGFYICRFVLTDLGLLLDKFLKKGTEWVMA